jgi:hypothetical protein
MCSSNTGSYNCGPEVSVFVLRWLGPYWPILDYRPSTLLLVLFLHQFFAVFRYHHRDQAVSRRKRRPTQPPPGHLRHTAHNRHMQSQVTTQKAEVLALLRKDGKINADLVEGEVDWFFEYTTHPNSILLMIFFF